MTSKAIRRLWLPGLAHAGRGPWNATRTAAEEIFDGGRAEALCTAAEADGLSHSAKRNIANRLRSAATVRLYPAGCSRASSHGRTVLCGVACCVAATQDAISYSMRDDRRSPGDRMTDIDAV